MCNSSDKVRCVKPPKIYWKRHHKKPPKNPNSKIQLDNPSRDPNSVNRQTRFLEGFLLYDGAGQTVLRGANAFKQFRTDYKLTSEDFVVLGGKNWFPQHQEVFPYQQYCGDSYFKQLLKLQARCVGVIFASRSPLTSRENRYEI